MTALEDQLGAPESACPQSQEEHERHACHDVAVWRRDVRVVGCVLVTKIDDVVVNVGRRGGRMLSFDFPSKPAL